MGSRESEGHSHKEAHRRGSTAAELQFQIQDSSP